MVGSGGDHDGALHTLGTKHAFDEFAQLAPTFADQGDDDDIGGHTARELAQQSRFADAGTCEQTEALAAHQRQKSVKHRNTGFKPLAKAAAFGGGWGSREQGPGFGATVERAAVQRGTKGIDDAANPAVVRCQTRLAAQPDNAADRNTLGQRIGQDGNAVSAQGNHLAPKARADLDPVAKGGDIGQTAHGDGAARHLDHPSHASCMGYSGDFGHQRIKYSGQMSLLLFTDYCF